jgi:LPXTG-motif cell wall-anchored protein
MKKSVLLVFVMTLLFLGNLNMAKAQEQPAPKKDTVNMDTDAKPQFYYAVEDEKAEAKGGSKAGLIAIIAGAIVVVGGVAFYFLKKKKQ